VTRERNRVDEIAFGGKNGERTGKKESNESLYILNIYILLSLITPIPSPAYIYPPVRVCVRGVGEREKGERTPPGRTSVEAA